jgi:hypothetical protein
LNDIRLKQLMGTGLIQGGTITLNADPTKFNIASGFGYIIDNWSDPTIPNFTTVAWNASSAITDLYIGSYISTDLFIDKNGALVQQTARVSQNDLRDYIFLGRTVHPNLSTITTVASLPHVRTNLPLLVDDLIAAIGVINISGNVISPSGTNLSLKRSAGSIFRLGSNFTNNPKIPNTINLNSADPVSLLYRYRNGSGGYATQTSRTTINPTQWDDGSGILQTIPNKYYSIQRVYQFTTGLTYITYGQAIYNSLVTASEAINSENPDIDAQLNDACLLVYMIVREDTVDLTNNLEAKIINAGKFSGTGGSSSSSGGNVAGPLSSVPNSIARFDGSIGNVLKDGSNSTIDDNGNAVFAGTLSTGGIIQHNNFNSDQWSSTFSTVNANSASWGLGGVTPVDTVVQNTSANWNSVYSRVNEASSIWSNYPLVLKSWLPTDNQPPSARFAPIDTRGGFPVLEFSETVGMSAIFPAIIPLNINFTGGMEVSIRWTCAIDIDPNFTVGWLVDTQTIDNNSLDTIENNWFFVNTISAVSVPTISGLTKVTSTTFGYSALSSLSAGDYFRLRVRRDIANDTARGNAELVSIQAVVLPPF